MFGLATLSDQALILLRPQSRPKLCVDDFQVLRRIGQGSFGQVFRVRKRDTKRICKSGSGGNLYARG